MEVRKLNDKDYDEILLGWWKDWRWTPPPKMILPENGKGGFIVYDNDTPVCAGFLYNTNSEMAWCEFIVSNFKYKDKEKRKDAILLLLKTIEFIAVSIHKKYLYSVLKSKSLIDSYESAGYIKGDNGYQEMIKGIWQQQQQ